MFCFIFNFQVNYEKLLYFLKVAASDDPQQSRRAVDSSLREAQGGTHHSERYFLPFCGYLIPRLSELAGLLEAIPYQVRSAETQPFTNTQFTLSFLSLCCKQHIGNYLQQLYMFLNSSACFFMRFRCKDGKIHSEIKNDCGSGRVA